jgi:glycosyltransferase involved in cell wall biosynthesis
MKTEAVIETNSSSQSSSLRSPTKPRIVLIGDFNAQTDEGMRRLCADISERIRPSVELLTFSSHEVRRWGAYRQIAAFKPDYLQYLTGPTTFSLIVLKAYELLLGSRTTTVVTGLKPFVGPWGRRLIHFLKPDVYLAQSRRWTRLFESAGCKVIDFPNGVKTDKFRPGVPERLDELREKFGLPARKKLVLHVGHVKANRNLECLLDVQKSGRYQVVVVGSETLSERGETRRRIEEAGFIVITKYFPNIEEIYQAVDFYVFTAKALDPAIFPRDRHEIGVIDFPLSILESMATNLRVLTTAHDAAAHFLPKTQGLRFFDGSAEDCLRQLDAVAAEIPDTRRVAEQFDIQRIIAQLTSFYASHKTK